MDFVVFSNILSFGHQLNTFTFYITCKMIPNEGFHSRWNSGVTGIV